jgi:hypothetical protein
MNPISNAQHNANRAFWPTQTTAIWEHIIANGDMTHHQFDRLTNIIVIPNLKGKTFENSTPANVTPEQLANSIIQMYQAGMLAADEEVDRQALRRMEGFIYIIIKEQRGSTGYEYGSDNGRTNRIYTKANAEGETLQMERLTKAKDRSSKVSFNLANPPKNPVTGSLEGAADLKHHLSAVFSLLKVSFMLHGIPSWGRPVIELNEAETQFGLAYLQTICEHSEKQEITRAAMLQDYPPPTLFFEIYQDITFQKGVTTYAEEQTRRNLSDSKKRKLEETSLQTNETIPLLCSRISQESQAVIDLGGSVDEHFKMGVLLRAAGEDSRFIQTINVINGTQNNKTSFRDIQQRLTEQEVRCKETAEKESQENLFAIKLMRANPGLATSMGFRAVDIDKTYKPRGGDQATYDKYANMEEKEKKARQVHEGRFPYTCPSNEFWRGVGDNIANLPAIDQEAVLTSVKALPEGAGYYRAVGLIWKKALGMDVSQTSPNKRKPSSWMKNKK